LAVIFFLVLLQEYREQNYTDACSDNAYPNDRLGEKSQEDIVDNSHNEH
jgi:hypothetical protein